MLVVERLQRLAFGPFELSLAPGECVGITGPSGAGKSVFLRMIADLDPHSGAARLADQGCEAMPAPTWRRLVTYVPAEAGWWAETVGAHIADAAAAPPLLPPLLLPADLLTCPLTPLSTPRPP